MDVEGDFSSLEATAFNMSVKDSILRPSVESGIVFDDKKDIQDASVRTFVMWHFSTTMTIFIHQFEDICHNCIQFV